jgi:PAS domain S-box-containing protein
MKSYSEILTGVLVHQSSNELFYTGNIDAGARSVVKEVVDTIDADRASIWMFNKERDSIILKQLYIKSEDTFYQDIMLYKKDFEQYFLALEENPIIVANDAETHHATSCFLEAYLKPLGVKSMLDVPVWYRGSLIGVICIESLTSRSWKNEEIDFSQILSSLYSFAYSVNESNKLSKEIERTEREISNRMDAINRSNAVIEFDLEGNIRYANDLFLKAMGYSSQEEIVGKHHSIFVEDGFSETEEYVKFWKTLKRGEFFSGEITRKKKDGTLIYLQATYNPIIGNDGEIYSVMKVATDITKSFNQQIEIEKKNTYLEHAAKILRHDMHSGINTYMPRGLSSLDRRITDEQLKELKIDAPLKMIREGLRHTQKVYKGVYEFTNLVKKDVVLNRSDLNLKDILEDYLSTTAYRPQVIIEDLGILSVNEALFCTAIDNLIRNGLKYNDSPSKFVKIYKKDFNIYIEDNGRGMSAEEFKLLSQPYTRKEGQKESGTGLGLNICVAILEEHKFNISCRKLSQGTQIKIKINN